MDIRRRPAKMMGVPKLEKENILWRHEGEFPAREIVVRDGSQKSGNAITCILQLLAKLMALTIIL
jgi:hypothetical protein